MIALFRQRAGLVERHGSFSLSDPAQGEKVLARGRNGQGFWSAVGASQSLSV